MNNLPNTKEGWLTLLKQTSIPSFSANIKALSNLDSYSQKHSSELARSILKDPNLTTSVLKLANSAHFNSSGREVRTISRAIMVLGFKSVKEICATCVLIESFKQSPAADNLKAVLARAFHSAIQTRQIALLKGEQATEELFISSLLIHLGEISVYAAADPESEFFHSLTSNYPLLQGQEKSLLGCYFNDLTLGLCNTWKVAPMLKEVMAGRYVETSPLRSILLGASMATSSEALGSEVAVQKHLKSLVGYTGKSPEQVGEQLIEAIQTTQKSLATMGLRLNLKTNEGKKNVKKAPTRKVKVDKLLQLEVIQELSLAMDEPIEINQFLRQLLEGIQRGGGFSCALVALLNPTRNRLTAKHTIELSEPSVKDSFSFNTFEDIPEVQQKILTNRKVLQLSEFRTQSMTVKKILKRTGAKQSLWGPLVVENKVIGCIYADNGNDETIGQQQKAAFSLFVNQARLHLQKFK